ncbi:unnamed protein product [Urochloa humidicola]
MRTKRAAKPKPKPKDQGHSNRPADMVVPNIAALSASGGQSTAGLSASGGQSTAALSASGGQNTTGPSASGGQSTTEPSASGGQSTTEPSASDGHNTGLGEDERSEPEELKAALETLRSLCCVLGINYNAKISEFGTVVEKRRLDEAIDFLITTRDCNFEELKRISEELITEWELSRTSYKRMVPFSWILYIKDANDAGQLRAKNLLSTNSVNEVKNEVIALKKARNEMIYIAKKKKLDGLLKDTHLSYKDIGFNPKKQVDQIDFKFEIWDLKDHIREVKLLASKRTQLVLRVELVRKAKTIDDVEVLIHNAKSAASAMNEEGVPYDGKTVGEVLDNYRDMFIAAAKKKEQKKATAAEKKEKKKGPTNTTKNLASGRTRKGTIYKMSDAQVEVSDDDNVNVEADSGDLREEATADDA